MDPLLLKQGLGVIIGDLRLIQQHLGMTGRNAPETYGLLNGIESVIDIEICRSGPLVTDRTLKDVASVLRKYERNPTLVLTGYYDLEPALIELGIDRGAAIRILTLFKALGMFSATIDRLNTENSPPECRLFNADEEV